MHEYFHKKNATTFDTARGIDSTTELSTDLNCRFPLFLVVHALQEGNVPELDPIVMACTKIMYFKCTPRHSQLIFP